MRMRKDRADGVTSSVRVYCEKGNVLIANIETLQSIYLLSKTRGSLAMLLNTRATTSFLESSKNTGA